MQSTVPTSSQQQQQLAQMARDSSPSKRSGMPANLVEQRKKSQPSKTVFQRKSGTTVTSMKLKPNLLQQANNSIIVQQVSSSNQSIDNDNSTNKSATVNAKQKSLINKHLKQQHGQQCKVINSSDVISIASRAQVSQGTAPTDSGMIVSGGACTGTGFNKDLPSEVSHLLKFSEKRRSSSKVASMQRNQHHQQQSSQRRLQSASLKGYGGGGAGEAGSTSSAAAFNQANCESSFSHSQQEFVGGAAAVVNTKASHAAAYQNQHKLGQKQAYHHHHHHNTTQQMMMSFELQKQQQHHAQQMRQRQRVIKLNTKRALAYQPSQLVVDGSNKRQFSSSCYVQGLPIRLGGSSAGGGNRMQNKNATDMGQQGGVSTNKNATRRSIDGNTISTQMTQSQRRATVRRSTETALQGPKSGQKSPNKRAGEPSLTRSTESEDYKNEMLNSADKNQRFNAMGSSYRKGKTESKLQQDSQRNVTSLKDYKSKLITSSVQCIKKEVGIEEPSIEEHQMSPSKMQPTAASGNESSSFQLVPPGGITSNSAMLVQNGGRDEVNNDVAKAVAPYTNQALQRTRQAIGAFSELTPQLSGRPQTSSYPQTTERLMESSEIGPNADIKFNDSAAQQYQQINSKTSGHIQQQVDYGSNRESFQIQKPKQSQQTTTNSNFLLSGDKEKRIDEIDGPLIESDQKTINITKVKDTPQNDGIDVILVQDGEDDAVVRESPIARFKKINQRAASSYRKQLKTATVAQSLQQRQSKRLQNGEVTANAVGRSIASSQHVAGASQTRVNGRDVQARASQILPKNLSQPSVGSPSRSTQLIKVVSDADQCPVLEQRSLVQNPESQSSIISQKNDSPLKCRRKQYTHKKNNSLMSQQLTKIARNEINIVQPPCQSSTGLILSKGKQIKQLNAKQQSHSLHRIKRQQVYSEQSLNATAGLQEQMQNNLQELIDKQIELDNKLQLKQTRKQKILDAQIESQKRQVAAKYANLSHNHLKKMRLHQKTMFHPRYLKNDLPANFWATKVSQTSPSVKDIVILEKQKEILNRINSLDFDDIDGKPILEELRQELVDHKTESGLTQKGLEIALWFYQNQLEKLPPRIIAQNNLEQIQMPIPFNNMAQTSRNNAAHDSSQQDDSLLEIDEIDKHIAGAEQREKKLQQNEDQDTCVFRIDQETQQPLIKTSSQQSRNNKNDIKSATQINQSKDNHIFVSDNMTPRQLENKCHINFTNRKNELKNNQDIPSSPKTALISAMRIGADSDKLLLSPNVNSFDKIKDENESGRGTLRCGPEIFLGLNIKSDSASQQNKTDSKESQQTPYNNSYTVVEPKIFIASSEITIKTPVQDTSSRGEIVSSTDVTTHKLGNTRGLNREGKHSAAQLAYTSKFLEATTGTIEEKKAEQRSNSNTSISYSNPLDKFGQTFMQHCPSDDDTYRPVKSRSIHYQQHESHSQQKIPVNSYLNSRGKIIQFETSKQRPVDASSGGSMPRRPSSISKYQYCQQQQTSLQSRSNTNPGLKKVVPAANTTICSKRLSSGEAVAERLYPYSKRNRKSASRGEESANGRSYNLTLNKLKQFTQTVSSDVAQKDHSEWLKYPSSVADLQKSAHIVLESQKRINSKIIDTSQFEAGKQIESMVDHGNNSVLDEEMLELKEARRQYLLGSKKNRKYVASTLFYGRYDQQNQAQKANSSSAGGPAKPSAHKQNNIKYISHPLKMLVIQQQN